LFFSALFPEYPYEEKNYQDSQKRYHSIQDYFKPKLLGKSLFCGCGRWYPLDFQRKCFKIHFVPQIFFESCLVIGGAGLICGAVGLGQFGLALVGVIFVSHFKGFTAFEYLNDVCVFAFVVLLWIVYSVFIVTKFASSCT
jgi:hypothetical protein